MESVRQNPERSERTLTRAVILAAGRGKRLRPFTDRTPKPLLPQNGRSSLENTLLALAETGITDVCLVTGHLGAQIETFVGDGSPWGMRATFCQQTGICGTADALKTAEFFLTTPAFVVAADYFLPLHYLHPLKAAFVSGTADLVVGLKPVPTEEVGHRSSVRFAENGRIVEIVEKPAADTAPSLVAASLLYILPPAIRSYLVHLPLSRRNEYELPDVINQMVRDGYHLTGCLQPAPPEWQTPD